MADSIASQMRVPTISKEDMKRASQEIARDPSRVRTVGRDGIAP